MASTQNEFDVLRLFYDVLIGSMFWNLLFALGPMVWFYPLNALDITGYEAFVLVCFSPIVLLFGNKLSRAFKSDKMMQLILIVMLGGCASFHCTTTLSRLAVLSLGVSAAMLLPFPMLWSDNKVNRITSFWGLVLSYMSLLASRIWYTSISPLWSDHNSNTALLTLFSIAVCSKAFFPYNQSNKKSNTEKTPDAKKASKEKNTKNDKSHNQEENVSSKNENSRKPWLRASLGLGALIFISHTIFGEVSVLSRYVVQGYPNTGPLPNPWGGLVLLALTFGLYLSMHTNLSEKYLWSMLGFSSSMGLMFLPEWYGFVCGVFLAIYIMSVWPLLWEKAVDCGTPGKTLCTLAFVYMFGMFALVWCTAYNFVMFGGEYTRERTYIFIGLAMFLIGWSATSGRSGDTQLGFSLNLPDMKYYTYNPKVTPQTAKQKFGKTVKKILFFIALAGLLGFEYRNRFGSRLGSISKKDVSNEKHFSALIWTFHFGYDNQGWPSFDRAADVLEKSGADVITLLESDASKPYLVLVVPSVYFYGLLRHNQFFDVIIGTSGCDIKNLIVMQKARSFGNHINWLFGLGNNDIAMWLGERLNMYADFGPSTRDHTWGNLLLSRYPIVKSQHHLLPSPYGELAPAVSATVNISGNLVDFVVTHMGNDRDDLDRQLQAKALSELCAASNNPVVFLGYVTSKPGSRDYRQLLNEGRMKDIDPTDKSRFCEYIMYRDLERIGYARISHGGLSDTELQMARWKIVPKSQKIQERPKVTKDKKNVPASFRFSDEFGSNFDGHYSGSNHHYHMSTPKYFTV